MSTEKKEKKVKKHRSMWVIFADTADKNYNTAVNIWKTKFQFWMNRSKWWSKMLWFLPLIIWSASWSVALLLSTLITPFSFPMGVVVIIVLMLVSVDKTLYMNMDQDPYVIEKVAEFKAKGSENLTDHERIAAIVHATWLQLEKELNGKGGWMANDLGPLRFFDNPQHREEAVRFSTITLVAAESDLFTRISSGNAKQDPDMLEVYTEKNLTFGAKVWGQYYYFSAESNYENAIKLMKRYEAKLLAGEGMPNATTDDLKQFLIVIIDQILDKAHDPVRGRGYDVPFSEVDDQIYDAVGYVAPLYNVLPIFFAGWQHYLDKGTTEQMKEVLDIMDVIVHANPSVITAFDGFSQLGDHRSKMSRYLDQLRNVLDSLRKALRS